MSKKVKPYYTKGPSILIKSPGRFELTTGLPHGRVAEFIFEQKEFEDGVVLGKTVKIGKGPGFCEVPTHIYVVDDFKREIVFHNNYADFLLKSYPELEAVEAIEEPAVDLVTIGGEAKPLPVRKRGRKSTNE